MGFFSNLSKGKLFIDKTRLHVQMFILYSMDIFNFQILIYKDHNLTQTSEKS